MFRRRPSHEPSQANGLHGSAPPSLSHPNWTNGDSSLSAETRRYALAAVLLEEWLLELASVAQEHAVADIEEETAAAEARAAAVAAAVAVVQQRC